MKSNNIDESLKKLASIAEWFDAQEEVDVEKGLEKVKEAVTLIKTSKSRLTEIENEFIEIKKEIDPSTVDEKVVIVEEESVSVTIDKNDSGDIPF